MNLENVLLFINKTFVLKIRNISIEPTYWEAFAIVFLIFLLILTFARVRYLYIHWSLGKQSIAFLFWGFIIALIMEGFFLIGGRTLFTEVLGIKNVPKPLSTVLDEGRSRLVNVLGTSDSNQKGKAIDHPTFQSVLTDFDDLPEVDEIQVKEVLCK